MFENREIAEFFARDGQAQDEKRRNPDGFRAFLTPRLPFLVEKDDDFNFLNRQSLFKLFSCLCFLQIFSAPIAYFDDRKQSAGLFAGRKTVCRSFSRFSCGKAWQKRFVWSIPLAAASVSWLCPENPPPLEKAGETFGFMAAKKIFKRLLSPSIPTVHGQETLLRYSAFPMSAGFV